ncbi:MAG: hypothetical protein KGN79_09805 [Acidobacteriota bacterium]|nr:hypothetical protein [Acidobacteriota bacterium]
MHTPDPHDHKPEEIDASAGYEKTDVRVTGILVFLTALAILVAVVGVLTYGIGKVINAHLNKEDGPDTKWTKTADVRDLGDLPNNPAIQKKMSDIVNSFPTPRLQLDDGEQDIVDLHQREDLLLNHYTWVDQGKGTVRIPIERAMELIAQRGLPVAPATTQAPLMTGDHRPTLTMPLTNGFARTGYEQELAASEGEGTSQK